jgi:ribonuclease HI
LPNGQLNFLDTTSPSNPDQRLNHKSWQTSSSTGRDQHGNRKSPQRKYGPFTATARGAMRGQAPRQLSLHPQASNTDTQPAYASPLESDRCTNNVAEYEAVILGLHKLRALGVTTCIIRIDSKVVTGQVEKEYSAKDPALMQYLVAIHSLEKQFKGFTLQYVDRAKNEEADALAKAAAKGEALPFDVFYHVIGTPAVRNPEGLQITQDTKGHRIVNLIMAEDWRAPITLYLQGHYHPNDRNEAK